MEIGDITAGVGFVLNLPELTAKLQAAEQLARVEFKPIPLTFQFTPPSALVTKFQTEMAALTAGVTTQTSAVAALVAEYQALGAVTQASGLNAPPAASQRRSAAMNTESTYARMLARDVNILRNSWQAERVTETETLIGMEKYGRQAQINMDIIGAQIAALKGKSSLNAVELKQLAELTALQNTYSAALKGTASTMNTVNGVITRGSLAAGVSAGVRDAANAVALLNNQYRAGTISTAEYTSGLTVQRSALLGNLTAVQLETVALRELGVLSTQDAARLAVLVTEEQRLTAAAGQATAALERQGAAQRAAASGALGVRGGAGMNSAAIGLSFVDPTLGMAAMALSMGPVIAGLAAIGLGMKTFGDGVDKAAIFQRSLTQIGALTHQSGAEMNVLGSYVQQLSTELPLTTQQLLELSRQAVLVGLHGSEGIKTYTENMAGLSIVLRDVNGHSADTAAVGQEVVKVLRSMGADTAGVNQQFAGAVNSLVSLKTQFGAQVPEITNLAKYWSSYAHEIGLTTDQVFGWSAALVSVGARAQGAGGSLQKFFQKLASDASEGSEGMGQWAKVMHLTADEALNLVRTDPSAFLKRFIESLPNFMRDGKDSTAVLKEFGLVSNQVTRAFSELGTSTKNVDKALKDAKDGINDTGLSFRTAMAATRDFKDQQLMLASAFDAFKTNIGQGVTPAMSALLGWMLDMSKAALNLSQYLNGTMGAGEINIGNLGSADQADLQLTLKAIDSLSARSDEAGKKLLAQAQAHLEVLKKMAAGTWSGPTPWEKATGVGAVNSNVVAATLTATGNHEADDLIGWCARWVKLTLEKAQPNAKAEIDRWFGGDANDVRQKLMAGGKLQSFNGDAKTLSPGDVVVYNKDKSGQGHIGIYIGEVNGRPTVRGNNELGGRNGAAITNEGLTSLGSIAGIVRAADAASGFSSAKVGGPTKAPPAAPPAPAYTGDSGNGPAAVSLKALQTEFTKLTADYKQGKISLDIYHAGLEAVRSKADQLAGTQKTGSKEWTATEQLVIKASNALKTHDKATEQAALTWKQWTANRAQAMKLAQTESDLNDGKLSVPAGIQAKADLQNYRKDPVRALALEEAERQLKDDQRRREQAKRDDDQANADAVRLAEGAAQAKIDAAQGSLEKLKQIQSDELADADTAAQKLAVIRKTSTAIYTQELAVAEEARKKAYAGAGKETNPALAAQARATADAAYNKASEAAQTERTQALNAARKASNAEATQQAKEQRDILARLTSELRQGNIQAAQDEQTKLGQLRERELAQAGENAAKKLAITKRYGDLEYAQAVAVAAAIRDKALKDSANAHTLGTPKDNAAQASLDAAAQRAYQLAVGAAGDTRTSATRAATDTQTGAIQKQRDAYHALAETLRQHVEAGDLDSKTQQDLTHQFNLLGVETGKLGLTTEKHVAGARAATFALIGQGQAAYLTAQRMQGMVSGNTEAADSALTVAESLNSVGQRGPAIELLTGVLSGLMDSAARGEASADSVDKLRVALNGLTEAQATEVQAQDFLSGLDGSIDEQIAAITAKLEDPNTSTPLRKAISDMTQDFGGSVTPGPMGEAATAALLAQRNRDVSGQIGGLDTLTGARLQGAMKDASDYLASEVGKQLEPATQEALQKAIDRAAAYMKASELLDLINKNPQDYADGARGLPVPSNYDPAGDARNLTDQRAITSSRQQQAITLLEAQHAQGLIREADYLQRRRDLDEAAAAQSLLDADQDGKNHAVSLAAYTAEMLAIKTKYQTDKKALDEKDRESERAAANAHATNMLALERSNATAALEFQHSQGGISERGYIDAQEAQAKQAALDKYLEAFNTSGSDMVLAWAQYQADLTAATNKGVTDRIALDKQELDTLVQGLQQMGSTFEQLDGLAGLFGKTLSSIGSGIQIMQKVPDLMKSTQKAFGSGGSLLDMAGAVGGWLGVASEAINVIGGIGDAILDLSPGFQAWKKNLTEVANLEKAAAGASTGLFKNPFADALNEDAAKRDKLAGAGFFQRLAWGLFGGAPQVLSDEAAKLKSSAATIFADLGQGISSSLTDGLMNAFNTADWSGSKEMFEKSLNKTLAQMYIAATVKASGLESAIQAYADAKASGKDGAAELAKVRNLASGVFDTAQVGLSALTGYGADASMSPASNYTVAGAAPAAQYGIPEIQFPASFTAVLTNLGNLDVPMFNASTRRLMDAANLIVDTLGSRGTSRSGLSGY